MFSQQYITIILSNQGYKFDIYTINTHKGVSKENEILINNIKELEDFIQNLEHDSFYVDNNIDERSLWIRKIVDIISNSLLLSNIFSDTEVYNLTISFPQSHSLKIGFSINFYFSGVKYSFEINHNQWIFYSKKKTFIDALNFYIDAIQNVTNSNVRSIKIYGYDYVIFEEYLLVNQLSVEYYSLIDEMVEKSLKADYIGSISTKNFLSFLILIKNLYGELHLAWT